MAKISPEQARKYACPSCAARSGQPCTTPTDTGRREVKWVHLTRFDIAKAATEGTPRPVIERVVDAITTTIAMQQNTGAGTILELACDCGETVELSTSAPNREHIRLLIEHVAYAHVTKRDVILKRSTPIIPADELSKLLEIGA